MPDLESALQPWQKLFDKYQPDTEIRHGFIGDGNGTVNVAAFPGWSWVRYDDIQSKLSMVRNHMYGLLPDGTPIVVGRRHHTDKYEQVLRVDFAHYASGMDQDTINQYILPPHGVSHRGLGSDPAPIDLNNIAVGKVVPDDPASLSVEIYSLVYEYACEVSLYAGEVLDLTAYVPVNPGHRYVLVHLDQATGAAGAVAGEIIGVPAGSPPVPDALPGTIPLAIVLLVNGQTTILIADIIQWKLLIDAACGTVGVHTHSDDTSGGTSLIGIEEFMFSCHDPIFLVGNAIWPTEVYHELQISAMYDGLDVEADLIWIHPDPVHGCGQILILKVADPGMYTTYKVNVRHGVGNIWLSGGDVTLDEGTDHLWLIYDGQYWCNDVGRVVAGVSGSGVANQVAYWSAANTITGDAGFVYDPATDTATLMGSLGIQAAPTSVLTLGGNALVSTSGQNTFLWQTGNANAGTYYYLMPNGAPGATGSEISVFSTDFIADNVNYERLLITKFVGGVGRISVTKGGTGTYRNFEIATTGSARLIVDTSGDVIIGAAAASAQLHVDQPGPAGAQPVLFLDQGDVSEQHIVCSINGADLDFPAIIQLDVTGVPTLWWDESEDAFALTHSLLMADDTWIGIGSAAERIVFDAAGDISVMGANFGVGTLVPLGHVHIYSGSAGAVTPHADADDLVIEGSANTGISIYSPDASRSHIYFASTSDDIGALLRWEHDADLMTIGTVHAGAEIQFIVAAAANAMRIDSATNVGIGLTAGIAGKTHIDQSSNSAAIPVLVLDQADISEGFLNFIGSDRGVITGATDSLESVRVEINGVVRRLALYVDA